MQTASTKQKGCCRPRSRKNGTNTNFNINSFIKLLGQSSDCGAGLTYSSSCESNIIPRLLSLHRTLLLMKSSKGSSEGSPYPNCHLCILPCLSPPPIKKITSYRPLQCIAWKNSTCCMCNLISSLL